MSSTGVDDVAYATTTDGFGLYLFANLPIGNYAVTVDTASLPAGLRNTVDPDGADDSAAGFDLTLGEADGSLDFGYVGTNSIGDTVFVDTDADGVQDAGELGLGGVTLTLRHDVDNNGSFETTVGIRVSAGAGTYQFDRLPGASYRVDVTSPVRSDRHDTGHRRGAIERQRGDRHGGLRVRAADGFCRRHDRRSGVERRRR